MNKIGPSGERDPLDNDFHRRSDIVTRASSARRRLFSICSALTCSLFTPHNWLALSASPIQCLLDDAQRLAAVLCAEDTTRRTASCLYSNGYGRCVNVSIPVCSSRLQQLARRDVFRGQAEGVPSCCEAEALRSGPRCMTTWRRERWFRQAIE